MTANQIVQRASAATGCYILLKDINMDTMTMIFNCAGIDSEEVFAVREITKTQSL